MLTQKDLKQIGKVFDKRLEKKAGPLIEKKLKPIKKDTQSIKKDTSVIISFFVSSIQSRPVQKRSLLGCDVLFFKEQKIALNQETK